MSAQTAGPETLGHLSEEPPAPDPTSKEAKAIAGKSPMQIAFGRLLKDKVAVVCGIVALFFVLIAVFAGVIADMFGVSLDPGRPSQVLDFSTQLPKVGPPNHGFDPEHPFGIAPQTGADNLAHWLYGARTSLIIAGSATLVASIVGVVTGLLAGFLGGIVDKVLSFVIDFFLTVPFLLAALTIAPIINDRFALSENYPTIQRWSLIAILAIFGWMGLARLVRGEVLSLREREFIQAARVIGMPTHRILIKELLPNLAAPIVVSVSLTLPAFVALEAGLAFLGIGVTSGASWGQTVSDAVPWFDKYALYLWEPLLGIVLLVLSLNLLGDAIRDAMDPKTRR
ncbi:ABC transporter permease [Nocardioides marmotae]|uniref:ABC transporter permease subunit n=1 Tax=Nocardioides marmotae TaxID=2663857 RepID=A0A6I3JHH0_9ACTN|nr:ABC transporter permease [Nocardioides marmotae]MCR6033764.1 ABC transporter permease subunit [Gordonia jinghuaiqii]MBC9733588.1 ABC transporter permease [Nocardioides marmotae]MTB84693.1 ABC transporter permease subunit [Nocardioides marmotae]MTB97422.1 ABC transporter permease subunit [Nocardioides marmotae]QKE01756.1 ABC transporter permease [Nocardioides marmotae]